MSRNRTLVYTACYGGFDYVPLIPLTPGADHICFTDDPWLDTPGWDVVVVEHNEPEHPRRTAKRFKLLPHLYVPDYRRRLWVDANVAVRTPEAVEGALAYAEASGIGVHRHPLRDDIYEEAEVSMRDLPEKYGTEPLYEQVEFYRREYAHPEHWGLWECGVIASHAGSADALFSDWWAEVAAWSYQDQLALPVVCRNRGVAPGEFPHLLRASPWFHVGTHRRSD